MNNSDLWLSGGQNVIEGLRKMRACLISPLDIYTPVALSCTDSDDLLAFLDDPRLREFIRMSYPNWVTEEQRQQNSSRQAKKEKQNREIERLSTITREERDRELDGLCANSLQQIMLDGDYGRPNGPFTWYDLRNFIMSKEIYRNR